MYLEEKSFEFLQKKKKNMKLKRFESAKSEGEGWIFNSSGIIKPLLIQAALLIR